MIEKLSERQFFHLSLWPPLVGALLLLRMLRLDPKPLIKSIAPVVPGMGAPKFRKDGSVYVVFDTSGEWWTDHANQMMKHLKDRNVRGLLGQDLQHLIGHDLSQRLTGHLPPPKHQDEHDDDEEHAEHQAEHRHDSHLVRASTLFSHGMEANDTQFRKKGKKVEMWLNVSHLVRIAVIPVLFLCYYTWDVAVLHREVDDDFPLERCMDFDNSKCFWTEGTYKVWEYPPYHKLECETMFSNSSSGQGYFFKAPDQAHFYKCYQLRLHFQDILDALGNCAALTALAVIVVIKLSVKVMLVSTDASNRQQKLEDLKKLRCNTLMKMLLVFALFIFSFFVLDFLLGSYYEDFTIYLFLPGFWLFQMILLYQRWEILGEQIAVLQDDLSLSDGEYYDDEEAASDSEGESSTGLPARLLSVAAGSSE